MSEHRLRQNFSFLSLLGLGFAVLNTWTALATSISLALPAGGTTSLLWGLVISGIGSLSIAASLAEIFHVFPRAGGQYRFCALLSSEKHSKGLTFLGGWLSIVGWLCLVGTLGSLTSSQIAFTITLWHPTFEITQWQTYLLFCAIIIFCSIPNFFPRILPYITTVALYWSVGGALTVVITCLSCARGNYADAKYVFTNFSNTTNWPDGVSWILGLLQGVLSLTAFDSVMHLAYEIPDPERNIPKAMCGAVLIGITTGFIFLMSVLFSANDIGAVMESAYGPILEIYYQATSSRVGATCLVVFSFGCLTLGGISIITSSSRLIWVFARDKGFPFSRFADTVHPTIRAPVGGIILTVLITITYGVIYIGSTSAFNAILSSAVLFLNFSYVLPIIILVVRGRRILDETSPQRTWTLGKFGYIVNYFAICFVAITTVFFCFPPALPVDAMSMNYAVVFILIAFFLCGVSWITTGRKHFEGHITAKKSFDQSPDLALDQKAMVV